MPMEALCCQNVKGDQGRGRQTGWKGVPSPKISDQRGPTLRGQRGLTGSLGQGRATAKLEARPSGLDRLSVREVSCSESVTQFLLKAWSASQRGR